MQAAAQIHQGYGRDALPTTYLQTDAVADMLELALMMQQGGIAGSEMRRIRTSTQSCVSNPVLRVIQSCMSI